MNETISTPLRLLWLTENYFPSRGGMAESCDRIVHALRRAGVTIDLAHLSNRADKPQVAVKHQGCDIVCPVGNDPAHALNGLWNLLTKKDSAFTHVVAFGGALPLLAAPVFSAWLGAPLITLFRGNDFDVAIFTPRRAEVLRAAIEQSARVCVVSRDKAQKINALFPHLQPVWIPNGIDLASWQLLPSHKKGAQLWRCASVKTGRRVLGMFGHIKQKKGGLFFLETLRDAGLAERFHLLFVGELDAEIVAWLELHHEEIAHSIFPFVDRYDLMPHYQACDLVIIPSFYDGLPNVLLEAAGLSIPLLAARTGGMADVLEDGRHGFLFHPGDTQDCRKALQRAASASPDELQSLGEACRSMVESRLHLQGETESYLNLLLDTVGDARQAPCNRVARVESLEAELLIGEP
jgi:glycosyltransferase involved in cell wall biosynthesis